MVAAGVEDAGLLGVGGEDGGEGAAGLGEADPRLLPGALAAAPVDRRLGGAVVVRLARTVRARDDDGIGVGRVDGDAPEVVVPQAVGVARPGEAGVAALGVAAAGVAV